MARAAWAVVLTPLMLVGSAAGGDHEAPRDLPAYAVQPPGASFEKTITRSQRVLLIKNYLHATCSLMLRRPVLATSMAVGRLGERIGVTAAGGPSGGWTALHQSPEAGGPCTPALITPLYHSASAYNALLALIASAQCRIDLMIFGWYDDLAGRPVADALIARARTGVFVRLMVDRGGYVSGEGNATVARGCPTFLDRLKAEPTIHVIETPDLVVSVRGPQVAVIDSGMDRHRAEHERNGAALQRRSDAMAGPCSDQGAPRCPHR